MILTLLLFAQLASHPKGLPPDPKWLETPVPHWTCAEGFRVNKVSGVPLCSPLGLTDATLFGFDPSSQEVVAWGWVKDIPASGKLRIDYPAELSRPGCEVIDKTDEATNRVRFSDESKAGFMVHGKPGHKLHLNCHAIIQRPAERSTN